MKKNSKKKKSGAIESSGVPSDTPVGLRGQVKTSAVDPTKIPVWKPAKELPDGIAVPPKKLT
jgi:hypothetical protein